MAEEIGALAVRIGADASQLVSELKRANKALGDTDSAFKAAAKAAGVVAAAASIVGGAMLAMGKLIANAGEELNKVSQASSVSVESLSALKYAAEQNEATFEGLAVGLRMLNKNMAETRAGTGEARDAFKALGLDVTDASGKMVVTEEMLLRIADRFAGMNDGANKTAIAMKIFGRSGADLIPFLNQGRAGIESLRKEAERLGIVWSTQAAKAADDFGDALGKVMEVGKSLTRELMGPWMGAMTAAINKMLEARIAGDSWFEAWKKGFAIYMQGGTDLQVWAKNVSEATARVELARKNLAAAENLPAGTLPQFREAQVARYTGELEKAKAALNDLTRQKAFVEPTVGDLPLASAPKKEDAAALPDMSKEKRIRQLQADAAIESYEIQMQTAKESADYELAVANENVEKRLQLERDRIQAIMDMADREQEEAIERGQAIIEAEGELYSAKLERLRLSHLSEEELEQEDFERRMEQLNENWTYELEEHGYFNKEHERLADEHYDRMFAIRQRGIRTMEEFEKASQMRRAQHMMGFLAEMTAGVAGGNKEMFRLNKLAAMSHAALALPEKVSDAYKWGNKWGGPPVGFAMAAIAGAAGLMHINAIASQQFGGGGAAPSVGAGAAAPVVQPIESAPPGGSGRGGGQTTIVNLPSSDLVSTKAVRGLLEKLNESMRDGGRIIFT